MPNWLDPAGNPERYIFMRWQNFRTLLVGGDAPLVPLASLPKALPADIPVIDAVARREQLTERKWAPQVR